MSVSIGHADLSKGRTCQGSRREPAGMTSPVALEPHSKPQQSRSQLDSGLVMSCDAAATIISTMRGYSDTQVARSELGCSSESNCVATNMTIFEILDR